jgi:membrane fusion protein (multidrug efflux system)
MRWYWQLAIIGVVGGGAYAAYANWDRVRPLLPGATQQAAGPSPPGQANTPRPSGPPGAPGAGPPPVVEVVTVSTGRVVEVTEAVGTTRALESVMVTAKVSGIVERILFEEGQFVQTGQELVRLDSAERQADLEAARAAIMTAQAQRNEINLRLERARQLRATGAGTEAQVADLTLQLRTSESAIVAAQARERASAARLDDLVVRAPFAGRVGVRQVSVGALLETRTAVTTLDDLTKVRLDFSVPEVLLASLRIGTPVRTRNVAFGNRWFTGVVAVIDTRIDPLTRSVRLTALIDNPDTVLRPGMFMNVALEVATRENTVLVPEEAIVGEGPRQIAFVVRDGRIDRRLVQIGQRQEGKVEVTEGLQPGEILIVRGVQRVRQGMQVVARPLGQAGTPTSNTTQRPQAQNAPTGSPVPPPATPTTTN